MAMPATASFHIDCLRRASVRKWPARAANQVTRARLIQAPMEVASAKPTCASGPISNTLKPILTAAAASAALTGVAVSPRAKKVATALRINTKGKSPNA